MIAVAVLVVVVVAAAAVGDYQTLTLTLVSELLVSLGLMDGAGARLDLFAPVVDS